MDEVDVLVVAVAPGEFVELADFGNGALKHGLSPYIQRLLAHHLRILLVLLKAPLVEELRVLLEGEFRGVQCLV